MQLGDMGCFHLVVEVASALESFSSKLEITQSWGKAYFTSKTEESKKHHSLLKSLSLEVTHQKEIVTYVYLTVEGAGVLAKM